MYSPGKAAAMQVIPEGGDEEKLRRDGDTKGGIGVWCGVEEGGRRAGNRVKRKARHSRRE